MSIGAPAQCIKRLFNSLGQSDFVQDNRLSQCAQVTRRLPKMVQLIPAARDRGDSGTGAAPAAKSKAYKLMEIIIDISKFILFICLIDC